MSDPTPGTDPTTPPAAPPAPPVDPATPPANPAPDPVDPPADDETDPRVKRANEQAAAARIALRDTKAELEAKIAEQGKVIAGIAAVFNPDASTEADPAQVAAQATQQVDSLKGEVSSLRAQLLVHELASDPAEGLNANPVALLDSNRFTAALLKLDPSGENYRTEVAEAIKGAVESTPSLRAAGQGPSRGGAPGAGQGPAAPGAVTQEQFDAMGVTQRNELYRTNPDLYRRLAANIR